jgi:hypothetical protein
MFGKSGMKMQKTAPPDNGAADIPANQALYGLDKLGTFVYTE